jgi:hypothetical protein
MSNVQSAFAKRVAEAGLTFRDVSWLCNIKKARLEDHSRGKLELTEAEMQRVNAAVSHAAVVYTIYRRELKNAVTITTGVDGVIKVAAEAV